MWRDGAASACGSQLNRKRSFSRSIVAIEITYMRTIWQSLAWKEWHEHKWKLVSITAILWATAAMSLRETDAALLVGIYGPACFCVPYPWPSSLVWASPPANARAVRCHSCSRCRFPCGKLRLTKLLFGLDRPSSSRLC